MSHQNNDLFLEEAKVEFEAAQNREERESVIQRLRDEGFGAQADFLESFIETGTISNTLTPPPEKKPGE